MKLAPVSLALLASAVLVGQQVPTPPPLVESIDVSLVNVDVTVTDDDGRPVTGLTEADFEILEDGSPQPIRGFYAIEDAAVRFRDGDRTPVAANDDFRRRVVLVFDNNSTPRMPRDAAAEFISRFVDNDTTGASEWAVISIGPSVKTLQAPTTDREAVRAALLRLRQEPSYQATRDMDRAILDDNARAYLRSGAESDDTSQGETAVSGYDFNETMKFQSREQTMRNLHATRLFARSVIETCRAYSRTPGNKVMLLITGGMELNTTFSAFDVDRDAQLRDLRLDLEKTLDAMVREANAANIKIYVVKAGGLTTVAPQHDVSNRTAGTAGTSDNPFFGDAYNRNADTSDVDSAPLTLALQTGGQYFPGNATNDSLARIDDATSNFYSLAYAPARGEDGEYHSISVRVKKPGLHVHHRRGYLALSEDTRFERTLRSPLIFSKEKGTLPVSVDLGLPEAESRGKRLVPITAAMPVGQITLVPRGDEYVGRVHVYLAVYDGNGENVGYQHRIQDVEVPAADVDRARTFPFRYTMKVGLESGAYTVVMTLRDDVSDQFGSAFQDVRL